MLDLYYITEGNYVFHSEGFELLKKKAIGHINCDPADYESVPSNCACNITSGIELQLSLALKTNKCLTNIKPFRNIKLYT